ncbi:MAG: LOG family protein [Bacilli bacterium]|nr:LOG family protein [Bacilli bacterium]
MRIFVGSSSNDNMPKKYMDDCKELLEVLLKDNDLVFGAKNNSLMGISYEIAKKNGRQVIGMCPEIYKSSLDDLDCDEVVVTNSIMDSTMKLYKNCDVMILLPGGYGTIYEFFTANYCKICNEIDIPIIVYNSCGFYDKLLSFIDDVNNLKLIRDKEKDKYVVANNIEDVVKYLKIN